MQLSAFHARVSRALRRGTQQDDVIPDVVAEAALFLEQNYSFDYMQRVVAITIDPLAAAPERIDFPSSFVKSWRFARYVPSVNADYFYLEHVRAEDVTASSVGNPVGFYTDGDTQIVLDSAPDSAIVIEFGYNELTDWPTDDTATPSLLRIGQNALLYQTMMQFSVELRDPRMIDVNKVLRDEALSALLRGQEEGKWEGTRNVMRGGRL